MQWLRRVYARIMFCPSLVVHDLLCLLGIWRRWSWVDDHVLLGRVPRRSEMVELRDMGVDAVINLCAEFAGHRDLLDHYGMDQLHLPTIDYTSPSLENVRKGVALLRRRSGVGLKTYVHCKAGRGRSPTLVLCYLLSDGTRSLEEAQADLRRARWQVQRGLADKRVVQAFIRARSDESVVN